MGPRATTLLALAMTILWLAAPVSAQTDPNAPEPAKVKVRFGPVIMNPTMTLGNIGFDDNVFNDATDPKRDFTMTISPKTELWLPFGDTWFAGVVSEDLVWYREHASERSSNNTYSLDWKVPFSRFTFNLGAGHTTTRDRPGLEIDERARRTQNRYVGSMAIELLANTSIDIAATQDETDFDEQVQFRDVSLHEELSRKVKSLTLGVSHKLTPLTTVTFGVTRQRDRFLLNRLRDSDITHATVGLKFDPLAVLKGRVAVGYSEFRPASEAIPDFRGATLAADLSYTMLEATRFVLRAERVVQYSYDTSQPYYVQTGVNLEIAQQVFGPVDVVVRGGVASLDYRNRTGADVAVANRSDRVTSYGGGVGYHLGRNLRIGVNVDRARRDSDIPSQRYERPSYGTSITYDF